MISQLSTITAAEHRADLLASAGRRTAARSVRSERPRRRRVQLRRRPAVA